MRISFKTLLFVAFNLMMTTAWTQLTAIIDQGFTLCAGGTAPIQFTATGGTPPYVFSYTVNGGPVNTITSNNGNPAVLVEVFPIPGTFIYTLVSVQDANTTEMINASCFVTVQSPPVINAGPDITICEGSYVVLSGSGGCTYSWDNGVTDGIPFIPTATTTYTVSSNCGGCTAVDAVTVTVLPFDPPTVTSTIDSAACHDGSIAITIDGNNPPYTVQWNNMNSGAMITDLSPGTYSASIVDASGCSTETSFSVPASLQPSNCGMVTGTVHYDENLNCVQDAGESPIANRMIIATPGNIMTFTDANGQYQLQLYPGNYTIQEVFNNSNFGALCTESYQVNIASGQTIENVDFLDTIQGGTDYQAFCSTAGNLVFMNNVHFVHTISDLTGFLGLQNLTGWFTIPQQLTMLPWNVPHTISNDTVYFAVDTNTFSVTHHVYFNSGSANLGDSISFCSGVISNIQEGNLANNTFCMNNVVIGPYDPNDITMFLNGVASDSTILATDMSLDYRIRFQNTGTAEAINVYVLDTISQHLDLSSFQLVSTSHNCQVSILDGNVLKFDFPLIHLPDSNTNEAESHGYVYYKIRQKPANPVGTVILNTAYIYFDFNEAVVTNTSYDKIVSELGLPAKAVSQKLLVHPNPSDNFIQIVFAGTDESHLVELMDLSGRTVRSENTSEATFKLEKSELNAGTYILKVSNKKGQVSIQNVMFY